MSLRDKLNENPAITTAVTLGVILCVLIFMVYQLGLFAGTRGDGGPSKIFLSDDGTSYYAGTTQDLYTLGPDGQPKAQAHVYQYPGQAPQIWYLERLHPEAVKFYKQMQAGHTPESMMMLESMQYNANYVRRPNEAQWYDRRSPEGVAIATPPPPLANGDEAEPLTP